MALVIAALLIRDHGDASLIVHAGPPSTSAATAPSSLTLRPSNQAYDGQFFYRLGVSPFSTKPEVAGVTYDVAALRNARWLSGALAWLLSAGHAAGVPWALLLINLLAAIALGAIAGALARNSGRHAGWGLLLALYPGYAYTLTLDTSELLAGALALGGLYAGRVGRWRAAAGLLLLAVLARDTTVVIPAGLLAGGAWTLIRRRQGAAGPLFSGAVAVAFFAAWQGVQRVRFHAWPFAQSRKANISGPFVGLFHQLGKDLPPHSGGAAFRLISLAFLVAVAFAALVKMRTTSAPLVERCAWFPATFVLVTLNAYLWSGATAFMRAGAESYLLSMLIIIGSRKRLPIIVPLAVGGFWALTVITQLGKG